MRAICGTRTAALAGAVVAAAVAGCGAPPGEVDSAADAGAPNVIAGPPNIILIMADDLGYGDISPYSGWIETPQLERLAAAGTLLADFHTSGAVCSPTRAGLVTGRYQHRAGVPAVLLANSDSPLYHQGIDSETHTIAEGFRELGYATAVFGKWHLGYLPQFKPPLHGFDEFRGFVSGNIDYQSHVDRMGRPDWWNGETLEAEDGYLTDLIGDHAERFIAEHRDEPFFLYLAHHAPHYPYQGPGDPADRTVGGEFPGVGSVTDRKRAYREMVQSMDDGVGRVLDALEEHGLSENTLVWFFSDNGATREGSNGALRGYKASYWEGGQRVPSIAAMPGRIAPGSTSAALTSTLDVMPSVLAMAGGAARPDQPFDGVDIGAVLFDGQDLPQRQLFWSSAGQFWRGAAVREGRYKLVIERQAQGAAAADGAEALPDPVPMLFDLETDLGETTDLAADKPQQVEEMLAALARWRDDVGVSVP